MYEKLKQMDAKELDLPETVFIRDIESKVFQSIVLRCLSRIEGIGILEHNLLDSLLGRELERIKGIHIEQDQKKHAVNIRVEINIAYGISIPEKAEEVQNRIVEEVSTWTGLHVSAVHVIFKNLLPTSTEMEQSEKMGMMSHFADKMSKGSSEEEYGEAF